MSDQLREALDEASEAFTGDRQAAITFEEGRLLARYNAHLAPTLERALDITVQHYMQVGQDFLRRLDAKRRFAAAIRGKPDVS